MTTTTMTHAEGRRLTIERKAFRRAVANGTASWSDRMPKPTRRFGAGLGEKHPIHRLPVTISDMEWWAHETAMAESRELEQRAGEFEAQTRLEGSGIL